MNLRPVSAYVFVLASLFTGSAVMAAATAQCPASVDVRNLMTVTQYDQAGLSKLNNKQLAALDSWLARHAQGLCGRPTDHNASTSPTAAAPCPSRVDVRDVMTVTQYDGTGLNKLNKKELATFNAWLAHYIRKFCSPSAQQTSSSPTAPVAPPSNQATNGNKVPATSTSASASNFGAPPKPRSREPGHIESRIVGEFHGWTGNTIFRLKNGQIWKQAGPGYFRVDLQNPKVVIKKLLIGYVLLVEGYGKEVFVRRIR